MMKILSILGIFLLCIVVPIKPAKAFQKTIDFEDSSKFSPPLPIAIRYSEDGVIFPNNPKAEIVSLNVGRMRGKAHSGSHALLSRAPYEEVFDDQDLLVIK